MDVPAFTSGGPWPAAASPAVLPAQPASAAVAAPWWPAVSPGAADYGASMQTDPGSPGFTYCSGNSGGAGGRPEPDERNALHKFAQDIREKGAVSAMVDTVKENPLLLLPGGSILMAAQAFLGSPEEQEEQPRARVENVRGFENDVQPQGEQFFDLSAALAPAGLVACDRQQQEQQPPPMQQSPMQQQQLQWQQHQQQLGPQEDQAFDLAMALGTGSKLGASDWRQPCPGRDAFDLTAGIGSAAALPPSVSRGPQEPQQAPVLAASPVAETVDLLGLEG